MNSGVEEEEEANLTRNVQCAKGFIALFVTDHKKVGVWNNATALTLSYKLPVNTTLYRSGARQISANDPANSVCYVLK